jgi:hypothetical protein
MSSNTVRAIGIGLSSVFPYVDYMLLKPRHVSVLQDHLQRCTILQPTHSRVTMNLPGWTGRVKHYDSLEPDSVYKHVGCLLQDPTHIRLNESCSR